MTPQPEGTSLINLPSTAKLYPGQWNAEATAPWIVVHLYGSRYSGGVNFRGGAWQAWGRVAHPVPTAAVERLHEIHENKAAAMAAVEQWLISDVVAHHGVPVA